MGLKKKSYRFDTATDSGFFDKLVNPSFEQESSIENITERIRNDVSPYCSKGEQGGNEECCHCIKYIALAGHGSAGMIVLGDDVFASWQLDFYIKQGKLPSNSTKRDFAMFDLLNTIRNLLCEDGLVVGG